MAVNQLRRPAAAALSVLLVGSGVTLATSAQAAPAPAPSSKVWITKYRNVKMPDVIRPGLHRFVVRSAKDSDFQIMRARPGYTKREATRDITRGMEKGNARAFKRFERNVEFRGGVSSAPGDRGVMWARLQPGTYWAIDVNAPRTLARKVDTFRVAGTPVAGRIPGAKRITATGVHDWAPRPRVIPRSGALRFYNPSDQSHFVEMFKLQPGKTVADFEAWMESGFQGPPPVDFSKGLGSGVLDSGRAMSFRYRLPAGNYILACFWPDPEMDMMPHAMMGMYREIRLK